MSNNKLDISRMNSQIVLACSVVAALLTDGRISLADGTPAPTRADISYGPHPHQLLDLYVPPQGMKPHPVLLWYGGLWAPSKNVPDVSRFFNAGCAVAAVEMRAMQDAIDANIQPPISVCLLDACRAVQFVRAHAEEWGLDPEHIAVAGGSQGALPALYVGCVPDRADLRSVDPIERESTRVVAVGAWRSQPTIDPKQMQDWVPGVQWGAPAFGCSFPESLAKRDDLLPLINTWSPDALLHEGAAPIFFENNWGLTQPENVQRMDYLVHAPRWALGFQKLAREQNVTCYVKFPDHPSEKYTDMWDFLIQNMRLKPTW